MNNLKYYVYVQDHNMRDKITKYNVLQSGIVNEIKSKTKNISDKEQFSEAVKHILRYHYWSRCEWEIILTSWPTYISPRELARLNQENEKFLSERGHSPYVHFVNLTVEDKIDVYDQVLLNWDIFINYLWENLK